jgi:hypothetical protein
MKTSLLLLLLVGCTSVFKKLDIDTPRSLKKAPLSITPVTMCGGPSLKSAQLIGTNPTIQRGFKDFLKNIQPIELDFKEQIVVWTLLQMNVRPDLATPTSRLQFLMKESNQTSYHDYTGDDTQSYPFIQALEELLRNHPRKKNLRWYAELLDRHFRSEVVVGISFEKRLLNLKDDIATNATLRKYYFRGDDTLKESERIAKINFSRLIGAVQKSPGRAKKSSELSDYRKTPKLKLSCNYDFKLYDESIFLIGPDESPGHIFGASLGRGAFLAVASQTIEALEPLFEEPVFKGKGNSRSAALCTIQNDGQEIWLSSHNSRDPGQHIYHLFKYGIINAKTPADIDSLLRHSRHIFLSDPLRLVIESSRSKPKQIQDLLKLNVPIYNAEAMGNIWAWSNFNNEGGRFYLDDRNPGALFCAP